ncbi:DJ-1/PfpI family protein [Candidatus Falkowbacteria bacterium]|nr:DJ-1/PfpI family protein [Candidatus Falkowbacteria bacterium]
MEQKISNKKILMIIAFRDFKDEEYFIPREILQRPSVALREGGEKAGAKITVASDKKSVALGVSGGEAVVDLTFKEVNVDDFDAVVFIGGPGARKYIENLECHRIAREAVEKDKILAAICIAPAILAKAGALNGKKATVWSSPMDKTAIKILEENGAKYMKEPVVVDGKIITANGPEAAGEFGDKLFESVDSRAIKHIYYSYMAKKITLDNLAGMIKCGFDGMDKRFGEIEKRMSTMEARLSNLEVGQEDIKLRLDNVAYRFEIVELQKRVDFLEKIILPKAKKSDPVLK